MNNIDKLNAFLAKESVTVKTIPPTSRILWILLYKYQELFSQVEEILTRIAIIK